MSLRVLFSGETPVGSAPTLALAKAIRQEGAVAILDRGIWSGRIWNWISAILDSDVVLFVEYTGPTNVSIWQYSLATMLGRPLVRWWVGSDVLNALENDVPAKMSKVLDSLVMANVTCAQHLVRELDGVGINAKFILSPVDPTLAKVDSPVALNRENILVYMPGARKDFYGFPILERLIPANNDLNFIVVGDDTHSLAHHSNVRSMGWMEDMSPIYDDAGCLIRITKHDGAPRMVLEALLQGKYVIYAWELSGCWLASTYEEAHAALQLFRQKSINANEEGRCAVRDMLRPDPSQQYLQLFEGVRNAVTPLLRLKAFGISVRYFLLDILGRAKHHVGSRKGTASECR
jgi:hypothetical protein